MMTKENPPSIDLAIDDGKYSSLVEFRREVLLKNVTLPCKCLEIGPFLNPTVSGTEVDLKILDFFDTQELRSQALAIGGNPERISVDYVCKNEQYDSIISEKFDLIIANHVVEHVVEFVKYFQTMRKLLNDGGALLVILPDRRYGFDRFRTNTALSQIIHEYLRPDIERQKQQYAIETEMYYDMGYVNGINFVDQRLNIENLERSISIWQPGCHAHVFEFPVSIEKVFLPLCSMGIIDFHMIEARMSQQFGEFALVLRTGREFNDWSLASKFYS